MTGSGRYIAGVRLRTVMDQQTPGLIEAAAAQATPGAAVDQQTPENPLSPVSSGDGVGDQTRAAREVRDVRELFQPSRKINRNGGHIDKRRCC